MITSIETLHTWDTEYSADSVEWCPTSPFQNVFVCGTYQLAENDTKQVSDAPAKRLGRLYLFSVTSSKGLSCLQTLEMPAILDTKWCHIKIYEKILLGVANAVGEILIYELIDLNLSLLTKYSIGKGNDSETLALSLDWSTGIHKNDPMITVSDSKGNINVLKWTSTNVEEVVSWKAHDFEAWITAFDYWNPSIIYTGGDDCKFKVYDIRNETHSPSLTSKSHEAGVTSLHSNAVNEHLLASGSYDENLRLWDTRSMKTPISTTALGGGIWRLKWDPDAHDNLIAACMHCGFRIVNCTTTNQPNIVASYNEHESLAYGSDWCHLNEASTIVSIDEETKHSGQSGKLSVIATCSFYDHKLCVSTVVLKQY